MRLLLPVAIVLPLAPARFSYFGSSMSNRWIRGFFFDGPYWVCGDDPSHSVAAVRFLAAHSDRFIMAPHALGLPLSVRPVKRWSFVSCDFFLLAGRGAGTFRQRARYDDCSC